MMKHTLLPALGLLAFLVSGVRAEEATPTPTMMQAEFFEKHIRPVLVSECQKCHGADKQKGGLRLDSRAALLKGGDSGPAAVAGSPEKSLLITALNHAESLRMPPKEKLTDDEIVAFRNWVKMGVPWPAAAE